MNWLRVWALSSLALLVGALVIACGPAASAGTTSSGQPAASGTAQVRYLVPTVT